MHHANLLIGSRTWGLSELPEDERVPSLDVSVYDAPTFTIDDARSLVSLAVLRPVERAHRTFVIACDTMLHEAQNALLKLFEDPSPQTVFYLIVPRESVLLPTLRSRLHLLARAGEVLSGGAFEHFKKSSYGDRLALIEKKLKDEDALWTDEVLRGAETFAEKSHDARLIREVVEVSARFRSPGASKKMLLEHLALTL